MASDDGERPGADHDIVLLQGSTEDGKGLRALRSRPGRLESMELREVREGQPIAGELVKLKPREGSPTLWDVDVLYRSERAADGHAGPARVATEAYRRNWESIFGHAESEPEGNDPRLPN